MFLCLIISKCLSILDDGFPDFSLASTNYVDNKFNALNNSCYSKNEISIFNSEDIGNASLAINDNVLITAKAVLDMIDNNKQLYALIKDDEKNIENENTLVKIIFSKDVVNGFIEVELTKNSDSITKLEKIVLVDGELENDFNGAVIFNNSVLVIDAGKIGEYDSIIIKNYELYTPAKKVLMEGTGDKLYTKEAVDKLISELDKKINDLRREFEERVVE